MTEHDSRSGPGHNQPCKLGGLVHTAWVLDPSLSGASEPAGGVCDEIQMSSILLIPGLQMIRVSGYSVEFPVDAKEKQNESAGSDSSAAHRIQLRT
jgi:hypothetical protein